LHSICVEQVIFAHRTPEMDIRLQRVLTNDPAMGMLRHADAGYEKAISKVKTKGIIKPSI